MKRKHLGKETIGKGEPEEDKREEGKEEVGSSIRAPDLKKRKTRGNGDEDGLLTLTTKNDPKLTSCRVDGMIGAEVYYLSEVRGLKLYWKTEYR